MGENRPPDGPPHVDDRMAAPEQRRGLVGKQIPHPLGTGAIRVVVVGHPDRVAQAPAVRVLSRADPDGVIEHEHPPSPRRLLHEGLHLRIVDGTDLLVAVEILHRGRYATELESLPVGEGAGVVDGHRAPFEPALSLRHPRARRVDVDPGLLLGRDEKAERGLHVAKARNRQRWGCHVRFSTPCNARRSVRIRIPPARPRGVPPVRLDRSERRRGARAGAPWAPFTPPGHPGGGCTLARGAVRALRGDR